MITRLTNNGMQSGKPTKKSLHYMDAHMKITAPLHDQNELALLLVGKQLPLDTWKETVHCAENLKSIVSDSLDLLWIDKDDIFHWDALHEVIWDYLTNKRLRGLMDKYLQNYPLLINKEPLGCREQEGYTPRSVALARQMMADFEMDNGWPVTDFLERPVKEPEIAEYVRERHLNLFIYLLDRALGVDWYGPMRDGLAAVLKGTLVDVNCRLYITLVVPDTPPPGYEDW
jgi:hypothetical protein